jgi:hypothetical protein
MESNKSLSNLNEETTYDNCELIRLKKKLMMKSSFSNVVEIKVNFMLFT